MAGVIYCDNIPLFMSTINSEVNYHEISRGMMGTRNLPPDLTSLGTVVTVETCEVSKIYGAIVEWVVNDKWFIACHTKQGSVSIQTGKQLTMVVVPFVTMSVNWGELRKWLTAFKKLHPITNDQLLSLFMESQEQEKQLVS